MSRRKKRRSDLAIDLTSMLDIIFILLMVVLSRAQGAGDELVSQQQAAAASQHEAELQKQLFEDSAENLNYVFSIAVAVPYDENDVTKRTVRVSVMGEEKFSVPLEGSDTEQPLSELENFLKEQISGQKNSDETKQCIVILSLNSSDDNILYRDERAVTEIFSRLSGENVYIRGNLGDG